MEAKSNDELAAEIAAALGQQGTPVVEQGAAGDTASAEDNPLETDFFRAMNAYRAARSSGDREAMEQAERHLQDVVRGELAGE